MGPRTSYCTGPETRFRFTNLRSISMQLYPALLRLLHYPCNFKDLRPGMPVPTLEKCADLPFLAAGSRLGLAADHRLPTCTWNNTAQCALALPEPASLLRGPSGI